MTLSGNYEEDSRSQPGSLKYNYYKLRYHANSSTKNPLDIRLN